MPTLSALTKTAVVGAFAWTLTAAAQPVLMLDFGPTAVSGTSTVGGNSVNNTVNSPYHTVSSGFSDTVWNQVQVADINSGLKYSDNTDATGVTINLGTATSVTTINLSSNPTGNSALNSSGTATTTGVYGAGSVGKDAIFNNTNPGGRVGVQISGLAAGTYEVYVISRNTNLSSSNTPNTAPNRQTVYLGSGTAGGNFDYSGYSNAALSYTLASDSTAAWVEGQNYVKLSVSLTGLESLNLAVEGTALSTGTENRGFLNAVQIVAVPEPASFALFSGLAGLAIVGTRRRRRDLAATFAA